MDPMWPLQLSSSSHPSSKQKQAGRSSQDNKPSTIPFSSSIHPRPTQSRAGMSSPPPPPPPKGSPALELLLDEHWFFSNTLANKPPPPPREDNISKAAGPSSRLHASPPVSGARRLLRTPSLPSPSNLSKAAEHAAAGSGSRRQRRQQPQQEEHDEEDDLNWSSIYEGVLRTRMAEAAATSSSSRSAALRRAPSMPVPSSSATGQAKPTPTPAPAPAPPTTSTRRRPSPRSMPRSKSGVFSAEEDGKWRSSGDLHGFRDPAGKAGRPPALVRVQSEARSAAEVKDQLRMWAQAVACNVRQEC